MTGIDLFRAAQEIRPGAVAIMITAYSSVDTAIEAMKMGAYDDHNQAVQCGETADGSGQRHRGRILSGPH